MNYEKVRNTLVLHLYKNWRHDPDDFYSTDVERGLLCRVVLDNEKFDELREGEEAVLSFTLDFGRFDQTTIGLTGNRKFECNGYITGIVYTRQFDGSQLQDTMANAFREMLEGKSIPDIDGGSISIYIGGMSYRQVDGTDDGMYVCSCVLPFQFDDVK